MTARRTRAGPSGCVRPCSQFLIVAGVNPKRAANRAWLRPSFWRTDRTSIMGTRSTLTLVTRTGTTSSLAHAIACFYTPDESSARGGVLFGWPISSGQVKNVRHKSDGLLHVAGIADVNLH